MTSITVTFTKGWLTDVTNPAVSLHAPFLSRKNDSAIEGGVHFYAGGRRRGITTAVVSEDYPLTFRVDTDGAAQLKAWQGKLLLFRDAQGRRVFGMFFKVSTRDTQMQGPLQYLADLTFTEVDYSEAV